MILAALALVSCGGGEEPEPDQPGPAAQTCREYRDAVAAVRGPASDQERAADFEALAEAAAAARDAASKDEVGAGQAAYATTLDALQGAYETAATALRDGDGRGYVAALDVAEPADDAFNGLAAEAGFENCALPLPDDGESGVSQSGFPATVMPAEAVGVAPPESEASPYPLGENEVLLLERGPQIDTGSVPIDEAATRFEAAAGEQLGAELVGDSGNHLVAMREYTVAYEAGEDAVTGTAHVFSGQGSLWLLYCQSRLPDGPSTELNAACERAVEGMGFLMF